MPTIEIATQLPLKVPAPCRIVVPALERLEGDRFALKDLDGGPSLMAQRDGREAVVTLVEPVSDTKPRRYSLDPAGGAPVGVEVKAAGPAQLEILIANRPFSRYLYDTDLPRPFLYPVLGPGEVPVTRSYPMKADVPGETKDHPHHRSLWTAYGEVNEEDLWSDAEGKHGWIRHQRFQGQESGPVFGGFVAENLWTTRDGKPLLRETRRVRVYNAGRERRLFDYEVTLAAADENVKFGDTKEGGLIAFRVATSMDGNKGGRIENSNGGVTEKECWGKQAAWCDYSGPVGDTVLGIAVMDHPGNFRHPTHWHVRDYGLFATNVFGTSSFEGGGGHRGEHVLPKGQSLTFRYRVLIHSGDARKGQVSDAYHGYIQPPIGRAVG